MCAAHGARISVFACLPVELSGLAWIILSFHVTNFHMRFSLRVQVSDYGSCKEPYCGESCHDGERRPLAQPCMLLAACLCRMSEVWLPHAGHQWHGPTGGVGCLWRAQWGNRHTKH